MANNDKKTVYGKPSKRQYGNYNKTRHNARTYKKNIKEFSYLDFK